MTGSELANRRCTRRRGVQRKDELTVGGAAGERQSVRHLHESPIGGTEERFSCRRFRTRARVAIGEVEWYPYMAAVREEQQIGTLYSALVAGRRSDGRVQP
jgi:hypothetical protein